MTIQTSVAVKNARLDAVETAIGATPVIKIRTGSQPPACTSPDSGSVLVVYTLGADWAPAASSGSKSMINVPVGGVAILAGTAGHYRFYAADGVTCHMQGSIGLTSADMVINPIVMTLGQNVNILSWVIADGNP